MGICFLKYENKKQLKNCGDDSGMVLLYDENLGDTIIDGDKDISINIIMESRDLVLSYLHIRLHTGDANYRI